MTNAERQLEQEPVLVEVTRDDLPLHCPGPKAELWSSHPRVYIPIEDAEDGSALCPYCGTRYQLV